MIKAGTLVMVENTVKQEAEPKPKLHVQWGKLIPGGILAVIVTATVVADIWNNAGYAYVSMGPGAALIAGAVGLMVGLAPLVAYFIGWDTALRSASGFCTVACVMFALFAYGEKNGAQQGAKARAGMSMADADAARQEARDARAEAAGIKEIASVRDLEALQASAKASLDSASVAAKKQGIECIQSKRCRKERDSLDQVTERLGKARAKAEAIERAEKAEQRVSAAKIEVKEAGPVAANAMASQASAWFSLDVRTTEQQFALIMMLVLVGSTLSLAFLGEHATKLMVEAFRQEAPKPVRVSRPGVVKPAEPAARGLAGFIGLCKHGEMVPIKEAHASMLRWWKLTGQKGEPPSERALSIAFNKAGFEKQLDRNKKAFFAVKVPEAGLRLVAGQDA